MKNIREALIKDYNNFIRSIELEDIYVSDLSFKRFENIPEDIQIPVKVTIKPTKNGYKKVDTDLYEVTHRVLFKLEYIQERQRKVFFELKATYKLIYRTKFELTDEIFKIFVERNVPINVIPFLRETISNSMYRAGLPPILLPLIKSEPDSYKGR